MIALFSFMILMITYELLNNLRQTTFQCQTYSLLTAENIYNRQRHNVTVIKVAN